MADEEKHRDPQGESTKTLKRPKDWWDKADVLIKFFAAALVAAFGFFGNQYLQDKQKIDSDIKLYTEIMSNKERAENSLRKDMFDEMLQSFLQPNNAKDKSKQDNLTRIRNMRLSLELLARNFHESLDMEPLFNHLLMEIVRSIKKLREKPGVQIPKKDFRRELDLVIRMARRVCKKQSEILEQVAGKIKLKIPLKGDAADKICTEYRPSEWLPEKEGICETQNCKRVIEGVSVNQTLFLKGSDQQNEPSSSRYFNVKVRYVYPKWKQVYVEIFTCPKKKGCKEKQKDDPEKNTASFWVGYFDFPLVEHTYLNDKYMYSVILNKFKEDQHGNDENAEITLYYYPSSYAGLKEKSFYNTQLMRGLLKRKFFSDLK